MPSRGETWEVKQRRSTMPTKYSPPPPSQPLKPVRHSFTESITVVIRGFGFLEEKARTGTMSVYMGGGGGGGVPLFQNLHCRCTIRRKDEWDFRGPSYPNSSLPPPAPFTALLCNLSTGGSLQNQTLVILRPLIGYSSIPLKSEEDLSFMSLACIESVLMDRVH